MNLEKINLLFKINTNKDERHNPPNKTLIYYLTFQFIIHFSTSFKYIFSQKKINHLILL